MYATAYIWIDLTNAVNVNIYLWTHDLVPEIDLSNPPSRVLGAARATEWMGEGSIPGEILLQCLLLGAGWSGAESLNDTRDLADCVLLLVDMCKAVRVCTSLDHP